MSYDSVLSNNPEINQGQQLIDRQAAGLDDLYFLNTSGEVTKPLEKLDKVDMEDRVVRRVDPSRLPIDKTDDLYRDEGNDRFIPRTQTLADGKTIQVWQRVDRRQADDQKYLLIGGNFFEIEFEKDGQAYLTTQVRDLFRNSAFTKGQSPAQQLELLQKIRSASGFLSWYQSGEYYRNKVAQGGEDTSYTTGDKLQSRGLELDDEVLRLEAELTGNCRCAIPPGTRRIKESDSLSELPGFAGISYYLSPFA